MNVPTVAEGELLDLALRAAGADFGEIAAPEGAIMVLAPHPDDETLGCGLAIMEALARGRDVVLVLLTAGGQSHPNSRLYPPGKLMALRRAEFAKATRALAAAVTRSAILQTHFLRMADTAVPHRAGALVSAVYDLAAIAHRHNVRTLWTTFRGDPHRDHVGAALLGDGLALRLELEGRMMFRSEYAVWGRFGRNSRNVAACEIRKVDFPCHLAAKARAMDAYASQLTSLIDDDPDGFRMPQSLVDHFATAPEVFVRRPSATP